jgi:thioredoxin reductase (NADPH)
MQDNQTDPNYEVIIIGAGPIGIELAIALQRDGLTPLILEAGQVGQTIMSWPPQTHFFSTPEHVALAGVPVHSLNQQAVSGEQYLAYLRTLVEMFDLAVRVYEPVSAIRPDGEAGFIVETEPRTGRRQYRARYVVFATGGLSRPRMLDIPGEDLPHVSHTFPGPHHYFRTRLLVVGGKNSALESALRCWRAGAQVSISYRRPEFNFDVVKPHLAMDISDRLRKGEITFFPATVPVEITPTHVVLASTEDGVTPNGHTIRQETDFVLLHTGFEADMSLLAESGVVVEGPQQLPVHDPATMETNVPGLFVAGTVAGGTQERFTYFISTCHDHVAKIVQAMTGRVPQRIGTIPARNNAVTYREVKAN